MIRLYNEYYNNWNYIALHNINRTESYRIIIYVTQAGLARCLKTGNRLHKLLLPYASNY